jgi:hypothetical protein
MLLIKGANMSHKLAELYQFIGNLRYYRREGYTFKASWFFATMTLPE